MMAEADGSCCHTSTTTLDLAALIVGHWGSMRTRGDRAALLALLLLSASIRTFYLHAMDLPASDPWRHLALVRNIRAGLGMTLYEGQPFIWYAPGWHALLAAMPRAWPMATLAACFSSLSVLPVYWVLRAIEPAGGKAAARVAGLLTAACGPLVAYTCHFGAEALAMFLGFTSLAIAGSSAKLQVWLLAGLLFGVSLAMRINFLFDAFLLLLFLRNWRQALAAASGIAIPLGLLWWRNHDVIARYPFVFTWDGLAAKTSEFGPVSTLLLPSHPDIAAALLELHSQILPLPDWIGNAEGLRWGPLLFMISGCGCVLMSGRLPIVLAGFGSVGYLLFFDATHSSNFFRLYLPVFPVFSIAVALTAQRIWRGPHRHARHFAAGLVAIYLASGAPYLSPSSAQPLELVTPPPDLLRESRYLVNSGFYQPESLIYRFPDRHFIGMPHNPEYLQAFRQAYPQYEYVLWHHSFSEQPAILQKMIEGGARPLRSAQNGYGHAYTVFRLPPLRANASLD